MDCAQVKETIWDDADKMPAPAVEHMERCASCREELLAAREIKRAFGSPPPFEAEALKEKILGGIQMDRRADVTRGKSFGWNFAWPAFAAAALVLIALMINPAPAPALNFDDLLGEHTRCVQHGHHKGFTCATHMALMEKTMQSMGIRLKPLDTDGGSFAGGEICEIRGMKAAHAVIAAEGKLVSRFTVKDMRGQITRQPGTERIRPGVWRHSAGPDEFVVVESGDGSYDVVIGAMPFEKLVKYAAGDL